MMQPQDLFLLSPAYQQEQATSYFGAATSSQLEEATGTMNEWEEREYLRTVEAYNHGFQLEAEPSTPSNTFNPMDHTRLSPSNFDPAQFSATFITPRFITSSVGGIVPGATINTPMQNYRKIRDAIPTSTYPISTSYNPSHLLYEPFVQAAPLQKEAVVYPSSTKGPVYDNYGSSVISVDPSSKSLPMSAISSIPPSQPLPHSQLAFNPAALGLPLPPDPSEGDKNWKGLYSSSGFDLLGVLARVVARPNPQIDIGSIDSGCSFLVCDAQKWDQPIVYASETFTRMTGYENGEILGQNCRFLQTPSGNVTKGSHRVYTDGLAAHHLATHITAGKESQTSMINYAKGGRPFVNLITVIPITWDSDKIAYYVGFQIDLVVQPSGILEKMKNGTFCVNYSLLNTPILKNPNFLKTVDESWLEEVEDASSSTNLKEINAVVVEMEVDHNPPVEILSKVLAQGLDSMRLDARKAFNKLTLDQSSDFVHVISLKGTILYASPSAKQQLEYDPNELTGESLQNFCHPSDWINVLRELKESANGKNPVVSLLYRIRRKNSGYVWLEASGKLLLQPGKGRKCVILVGRPRELFEMPKKNLELAGGFGDKEFWAKISLGGTYLYATPSVEQVLGYSAGELLGVSIEQLSPGGGLLEAMRAMRESGSTTPVSIRHNMICRGGLLDVVTHLHPNGGNNAKGRSAHYTVIAQTNLYSSEIAKRPILSFSHNLPRTPVASPGLTYLPHGNTSPASDYTFVAEEYLSSSDKSPIIPSIFKALNAGASHSENLFEELEVQRSTSFHYELQQLRLTNKKLREEKENLLRRKANQAPFGVASNPRNATLSSAPTNPSPDSFVAWSPTSGSETHSYTSSRSSLSPSMCYGSS